MSRTLETVIELQSDLERLRQAEAQLGGIPDWMRELHDQYSQRKEEIDALEEEIESLQQVRRDADAGIADAQEKLKRYQRQINEVTNQREYGALLQEIDTVKTTIGSLEEEGVQALERSEAAAREVEEKRSEFQELNERYQAELARWEEQKPEIAREATRLKERIDVLRERLPRPHLAQFERIDERTGGRALAAIRRVERVKGPAMWHCSACNYNVRPQVLVEIQDRGSLIQCDSCKRILYMEEQAEPAETQGAGR